MRPHYSEDAIAIVGYSHRLPGPLRSDDDFWQLLRTRGVVRARIAERFGRGIQPIDLAHSHGRTASAYEGLIDDDVRWAIDRGFFGFSYDEMARINPLERMLLGCAWETMEHAGWSLNTLRNSPTGVYVGAQSPAEANYRSLHGMNMFSILSISLAIFANRISHKFNLMGPSMTCCTACSAGLTALHTAINGLLAGDCDRALVGAVNSLTSPRLSLGFNALGVISPSGRSNSFDASADGYMRAEGSFCFAIKRLVDAERDGDRVYAVVETTAVNTAGAADGAQGLNNGRFISAPTQHSQVALMRSACVRAGRQPQEFDYIEAHATGTVVGDRIEGNAIAEAYGGCKREHPLRVASVKSNLGHMEAAAFHCGLLKTLLMMRERTFAPIGKHFQVPNLDIDFERGHMQVPTTCEPFPDRPVVVGINSFGFGGANGHCVVSEYRPVEPRVWSVALAAGAGTVVPLSARTSATLVEAARDLRNALRDRTWDLYTLAGNLGTRRTHFPVRTAFAVQTVAELRKALEDFVQDPDPMATADEDARPLVMVFSGQGTQWAGCGRELYDAHPVFRRVVDAVEEYWCALSDRSLRSACFTAPQSALDDVELAQPVIFMVQCALVEMFKTWGVHADCVVGHSSGEVAAAYACGALSLRDATRLVYHRATLQQRVAGSGRMLVIGLDIPGVEDVLKSVGERPGSNPAVEIACENAPASTVVCGTEADLEPIVAELERRQLQHQLIPGNIAFHSSAMDPIRDDVLRAMAFLDDLAFDAEVPMISSVTGHRVERLDSGYWWGNIRKPVRFLAAMETILREISPGSVLEVAPHSALQGTIVQCLQGQAAAPVCLPSLLRGSDTGLDFHRALGRLYLAGHDLDFRSQFPMPRPITHLLPGHPLHERTDFDVFGDQEALLKRGELSHGPLIGHALPGNTLLFEARLSVNDFPWLADHRIYGSSILPAAGFIELVLEALDGAPVHIEELEFLKACPIPETPVRLQTHLIPVPNAPDAYTVTISTQPYDNDAVSEVHSRGRVSLLGKVPSLEVPLNLSEVDTDPFGSVECITGSEFYERLEVVLENTFVYGPAFRTIRNLWALPETKAGLAEIDMDPEWWARGQEEGFALNPMLLDGLLQVMLMYLLWITDIFSLPSRARRVTFLQPPTSPRLTCYIPPQQHLEWKLDEVGQVSTRTEIGEWQYHNLGVYDRDTGALVAVLGEYATYVTDRNWSDLAKSKHRVSWQPKFIGDDRVSLLVDSGNELSPSGIVEALRCGEWGAHGLSRVVEWAGSREPDQTALHRCVEALAASDGSIEYWLVADTPDAAQACYDSFHRVAAPLRFEPVASADQTPDILDRGLLRPAAAELQLVHSDRLPSDGNGWRLMHRLAVAGGLLLVLHEPGAVIHPDAGWTTLRAKTTTTLLRASVDPVEAPAAEPCPATRWVLGEQGSWAAAWADRFAPADVHLVSEDVFDSGNFGLLDEWPFLPDVQAIDFFCGFRADDPTGEGVVSRFIAFVQAVVSMRLGADSEPCRLTVVTHGAVMDVQCPRGQALWGAVRSMAAEVGMEAALDFRLVDLGSQADLPVLEHLARRDVRESELAVRDRRLWAPRIISENAMFKPVAPGGNPAFRLDIVNPGQLDGLQMKTYRLADLDDNSVEIEVAAAALNFRDVMVALTMLPAAAFEQSALGNEVGIEGSGVVRRVGAHVRHCRPGDEVVFTKGGCIANRLVVSQFTVFPKPSSLNLVQGASILSVYVTSYYALLHLARLREGQRVLIHSAMGGVGLSAIALSRHAGAEIYATAGTEEKRDRLRALGVRAVFDSHSFDWYDELMAITDGDGVDVVLNSLSGHHVALCLNALRPGGWHCEIGKVDIYADHPLGLFAFRRNLRFAAIDIDRLMLEDPVLIREISRACLDLLERERVPPLPVTVYPYRDYAEALRLMMSGQHQGKVVLKAPPATGDAGLPIADRQPYLDPDATYLVTGGLGGLGLQLLTYLTIAGARHLTLMDRDPERRRTAEWVRRTGSLSGLEQHVELDIVAGDVACAEDVQRCVAHLRRPLKGVFHLAGVIDDQLLLNMRSRSVAKVFAPKASGAWHLHRATADCPLDHFVLVSSVASTFGNPAQVNYSAASGFLDGLAAWRRRQGRPGLSINTSAIKEAGMAARSLHVLRLTQATGLPPVSTRFFMSNLDYAMRTGADRDHLVTALFRNPPWFLDSPVYMRTGHLLSNPDAFRLESGGKFTVDNVVDQIAAKVAELCGHDEGGVDEPLSAFGLNSISVAELGTFIQSQFQFQVSALELMTKATCRSLAEAIVGGTGSQAPASAEAEQDLAAVRSETHCKVPRRPSVFAPKLEEHFPDTVLEPEPV